MLTSASGCAQQALEQSETVITTFMAANGPLRVRHESKNAPVLAEDADDIAG